MSDITTDYIRGFADRRCQVSVPGKAIIITAGHCDTLRQVYAFLIRNGIKCNLTPTTGGRSMLRIGQRASLEKWRDLIGFTDSENNKKLDEILSQ